MADLASWFAQRLSGSPRPPVFAPQQQQQYVTPQQQYAQQQPQQQPQWNGYQIEAARRAGQITTAQAISMGLQAPKPFDTAKHGETGKCPECGDVRYFTRHHLRDKRTGLYPAPLCMSCGFSDGVAGSTVGQAVPPGTPEWGAA